MGEDKATMRRANGTSLAVHVGRLLATVAEPCREVGPGASGLLAVMEEPPGRGPLLAVLAGARALVDHAPGGWDRARGSAEQPAGGGSPLQPARVLVVATDLPQLDLATLAWLRDHPASGSVVPVVAGHPQPLCARWDLQDLLHAADLVAAGERSLRALVASVTPQLADPSDPGGPGTAPFADADTPADADRLGLRPPTHRPSTRPPPTRRPRPGERPAPSPPPRPVTGVRAVGLRPGRHLEVPEQVATEEPLEIRAAGPDGHADAVAVTMRTPGHDFELAAGFLATEGLVMPSEVAAVAYCDAEPDARFNVVTVSLTRPWVPPAARRQFLSTSSCGICGKASIDEVELACPAVAPGPPIAGSVLVSLPDRMRRHQTVFDQTGGLHAAALFTPVGELIVLREDVGRHNAVDKVAGHLALAHHPAPPGAVLAVSGRVSFEVIQKAAMAGIGVVAAVSAPSSLAVRAAERLGVTVAGFVRDGAANLYSHPERVRLDH
jgi:FdhD protein